MLQTDKIVSFFAHRYANLPTHDSFMKNILNWKTENVFQSTESSTIWVMFSRHMVSRDVFCQLNIIESFRFSNSFRKMYSSKIILLSGKNQVTSSGLWKKAYTFIWKEDNVCPPVDSNRNSKAVMLSLGAICQKVFLIFASIKERIFPFTLLYFWLVF